jgi:chromosome segregation ATPase
MLKKIAVAAAILGGTSSVVGLATTSEYLNVLGNRGAKAIEEVIPMDVQIDRLGLILTKLDDELADSRRVRAEAAIRLEKASRQLEDKREELQEQRQQIENCKARLSDSGASDSACTAAKGKELASWTRSCLDRFKATQRTVENLEQTVEKLKQAQSELAAQLNTRRQERDELAARLEVIRTEKESLAWLAGGSGNLPSSDNLKRASELAVKLEDKLQVERAIVSTQDDLWSATAARDDAPAASSDSLLAEIDQTLGSKDE